MQRRPAAAASSMSIVPPAGRREMPCRTAFSTRGCSTRRGRRQLPGQRLGARASAPAGARRGAAARSTGSARPVRLPRPGSNRPRRRPARRGTGPTGPAPRARPRPGSRRTRPAMVFMLLNRKCGLDARLQRVGFGARAGAHLRLPAVDGVEVAQHDADDQRRRSPRCRRRSDACAPFRAPARSARPRSTACTSAAPVAAISAATSTATVPPIAGCIRDKRPARDAQHAPRR